MYTSSVRLHSSLMSMTIAITHTSGCKRKKCVAQDSTAAPASCTPSTWLTSYNERFPRKFIADLPPLVLCLTTHFRDLHRLWLFTASPNSTGKPIAHTSVTFYCSLSRSPSIFHLEIIWCSSMTDVACSK